MKLLCILCLITLAIAANAKLDEKFQWTHVDFDWPSETAKQKAITAGEYVPSNNLPLALARWRNKLFITVPRLFNGVPSTLNYINLDNDVVSPKLKPYPGWQENYAPAETCKNNVCRQNTTIVSTYRVQVDQCNRLWVLDTGLVDIKLAPQQLIHNAIVIFDLETDQLIRRFNIPKDQILKETLLSNIVVDMDKSDCSNAYAYLGDLSGNGLIIYSFKNNKSYRVNRLFADNTNYPSTDGTFAITIGPSKKDLSNDIYFHSSNSIKEYKVSNRVLQNKKLALDPNNKHHFQYVGSRGNKGQSAAEVYDKTTGVMFYSHVIKNALSCWNVATKYESKNQLLLAINKNTLVFISDMKVDDDSNLWVLSNRMPAFLNGSLSPFDINFRVLVTKTKAFVQGSRCLPYTDRMA